MAKCLFKSTCTRILLVVALIVCFGLAVMPVQAADGVDISIDIDRTEENGTNDGVITVTDMEIEEEFFLEIYVTVDSDENALAADVFVNFDPDAFQCGEIVQCSTYFDNMAAKSFDNDNGYADYGGLVTSSNAAYYPLTNGEYLLCTMVFEATAAIDSYEFTYNQSGDRITRVAYGTGNDVTGTLNTATVTTLPGIEFEITGLTDPVTAGTASGFTVTVTEDEATKTDYVGTVTFTSSDDDAAIPADYTFTLADAGVKTFDATAGVTFKTSGDQTLTGTDTTDSNITGTSAAVTVNPDTAAYLVVTGDATTTAGATNQLTVTAYDQFGNVDTNYEGDKAITFSGPAASSSGNTPTITDKDDTAVNVGTATTLTFTDGASTTGGLLTPYKAEDTTVDASDDTIDSTGDEAYDLDLTVNSDTANYLVLTGDASMAAGDENELTITAYDLYGNVATGYDGAKNLTFLGLADAPDTTTPTVEGTDFGSATSVNFTDGVSDANAATLIAYKAETATVDVNDGTIATREDAYDLDLVVTADDASYLEITGTATMTAGTTNELTITAYDQYDNVATGYDGAKNLTFTGLNNSPNDDTPTVEAHDFDVAASFTFTDGVTAANAATLIAYKAETATVDVSDGTIGSADDAAYDLDLTVEPAATDALVVYDVDDPIEKGATSGFKVKSVDEFGNTVTDYTGEVEFTSSDSDATLPIAYTFELADNGVHTFVDAVSFVDYGEQSLTATDTADTTITGSQTAITVTPVITDKIMLNAGWNYFSVPYSLEDSYRSWSEVISISSATFEDNKLTAYYYDPTYAVDGVSLPWRALTDDYDLHPCDAIAVKMASPDEIWLASDTMPSIPSKQLYAGWNLIGLSANAAMDVDDALTSVYTVTGDLTGYAQVVSTAYNATDWIYLRDNANELGVIPQMTLNEGFWIFMVNDGTLGGFLTTPLPPLE